MVRDVYFDPGVVVQPGDVYVIASNSADQTVLNSSDATYVYADPWYVTSFNGDDVRALARATDPENNIIDIIGTLDWDGDGIPGEEEKMILDQGSQLLVFKRQL